MQSNTNFYCLLLWCAAQGYVDAKVADIHIPSPEEMHQEEQLKKQRENEKAKKVLDDPTKKYEDKLKALEKLSENYEIV